ncbi:extracellular solute-binding protein [Intrasporangium calvum]|uniref:Carbohydrate ABC transporter substrate-binding protein, CUT1 family n=1 Tax=Intrasporangium calvum (strain ATCC 23552 / DSM 43043 / JCM 3097 / NBRC 12989 / NCIMB 10167 / NRRL B-3866 / 7 KIP) TaxID=710696 RepID=E6S7B9_INTC7|nr:extracellular solute-binding protein [Intrasporangium calvum]ADU50082.1 carbohydrate ABC transporter substrate-binding protein, CUT1 family [Intrasporangium calvum DSM 43043]
MTTRTQSLKALSAVAVGLLALSACGSSAGADSSAPDPLGTTSGPITLKLATFNQFGYEDLITEYMATHSNITIEHKKAATSNEARDNLNTRLAAGSGLSDIEAVEVDWLPELMQYSDKFVDLTSPEVTGRWLDWKVKAATDEEGRLIGYGTDVGPEAICYRGDLFEKAGLPSDREAVAQLLGNTWDSYFAAGRQFAAKSEVPWFDSLGATWQGMVNQIQAAYESPAGDVIATTNPEVKQTYDAVVKAGITDGLSAKLQQWSDDWVASFQDNGFATMLCPGWMVGVIEGNAKGVKGWDVANTFPGGGGNWGGSYLTVPTQSEHQAEAKAFAAWLTAPEQQIKAFQKVGAFPSQQAALDSPDLASVTVPFFNDAPTGQIFADRAKAVTVSPFKGPKYFPINDAMQQALTRVEDGSATPEVSWEKFVADVQALG